MKHKLLILVLLACGLLAFAAQGPLTNALNLRVRTDANGYLMSSLAAYVGPDGPLTSFGNIRLRTDANGYLLTTTITSLTTATVDAVTVFAVDTTYMVLACTGAETINTITGGVQGMLVYLENTDTDCTIADDETPTAANAVDLIGAANDVGAAKKIIVLMYNGNSWQQVSESDN